MMTLPLLQVGESVRCFLKEGKKKRKASPAILRNIYHSKTRLDFKETGLNADTRNEIQQTGRESDICYIWITYKNHFQRHCPRVSLATPMDEFGTDTWHFSKLIRTHRESDFFFYLRDGVEIRIIANLKISLINITSSIIITVFSSYFSFHRKKNRKLSTVVTFVFEFFRLMCFTSQWKAIYAHLVRYREKLLSVRWNYFQTQILYRESPRSLEVENFLRPSHSDVLAGTDCTIEIILGGPKIIPRNRITQSDQLAGPLKRRVEGAESNPFQFDRVVGF